MSVDELIRPSKPDAAPLDPPGSWAPVFDMGAFALLRGGERDAELLGVAKLIRELTVVQAEMIQSVAVSGAFSDDAHCSAKSWVEAVLNSSPTTAANIVKTAELLADVPQLASALRAGSVGCDQVDELRKLYGNDRCRAELRARGYRLVGPAKQLTFSDFHQVLDRWKAHVDPDGNHRDHEASRQRRHVRFGTVGHEGVIHAEGDAASTEEMIDILKAHVESEFLKDCEERRLRHGVDAEIHPLRRTHGQRCYDALQEIFRKAAGTGVAGVSDPTVNIFTTEAVFAAAVRDYFGQGCTASDPWAAASDSETSDGSESGADSGAGARFEAEWQPFGEEGFCETEHGAHVDRAEMVIAALLGKVRSVVVTEDGRYLHAGSRRRLFTGKIREMILLLGRHHCSRHGCGNSGPSIQVDHVESHACGGCTTALNGGPLCPLHNRDKYDLGFTVNHDRYGWHHHRPDGTEIAPRGT
ncbi:MAG: DUF222 domain-containing protein [Ilumatobacteraceae bacterium]